MKVLLLGATGTAGSAIAKKLLSDTDCEVTLFARHAGRSSIVHPRATAIDGNAANPADLRAALQGQDVVYSAISGHQLPDIAANLVTLMDELGMKRLIFMGAVGIYNELPEGLGAQYNVDNEPPQVPNRKAVDILEASDLDYTVLRPGFLQSGSADDFALTMKGEPAKGYVTTVPSVVELAVKLIQDSSLYVRESVSITKDMTKQEEKRCRKKY